MKPENLVDYHCHLDLLPDFPAAVEQCERGGIYALTMTTTPKAWPRNRELTTGKTFVHAALGLHPQLVSSHGGEIDVWESYLSQTRYVGEVGLDAGPRYYSTLDLQKAIFQRVLLRCSQGGGKILSIHSVRAGTPVLNMIEQYLDIERNRVVLHWFTGSKAEAKRASDLGCYFSLNAQMLQNPRHRETVRDLPVKRILTETDAPFGNQKGVPLQPGQVLAVLDMFAKLNGMDPRDVAEVVKSNLAILEAF